MKRWVIIIDIEGFSKIYPEEFNSALRPLGALMESLYIIGNRICPETPNRLFAHQIGDGFVIVSEFAERSPELPIGIASVLMRSVAIAGGLAKCAISQGEFADVAGCYPQVIRDNADESSTVRLGSGLMRVFPVMGAALINAHRLSHRERGSLLLLDASLTENLPAGTALTKRTDDYVVVDWIHTDTPEIKEIEEKARIALCETKELENLVTTYIARAGSALEEDWIQNTLSLNGCRP